MRDVRLKIMVVDDEPAILQLFQSMIQTLGYEVEAFAESPAAAEALESQKFDGFVFDVMMPDLDGFEMTRRVRGSSLNGSAPVVMITGLNDVETMRKGFSSGATFFLAKPFTSERVYSLFNAVRGTMMRERRRHLRLPFSAAVECTHGERAERHFRSSSVNLSETGMALESSGGLELGQELSLKLTFPWEAHIPDPKTQKVRKSLFAGAEAPVAGPRVLRARVVRIEKPDGMAVEFINPPPDVRDSLQRYINGIVDF